MTFSLPPDLHSMPLAASYLEALGKHHRVPLLGFCKRLENWSQHLSLQQSSGQAVDTTRAIGFDFELPDNLPLAVAVNAVRTEAALVALWHQQGFGETAPVPMLLPLLATAWWQVTTAPQETPVDTPWQQLLHSLMCLRKHTHDVNGLRLLLAALFQLNEAWQQYGEQALQLALPPYPQWQRLLKAVTAQPEAAELTPEGVSGSARTGLLPLWLEGKWRSFLEQHGLLPNVPIVQADALKQQHENLPLATCFNALVGLYKTHSPQGMPSLCLSGARVAMEWRAQVMQLHNKGNE